MTGRNVTRGCWDSQYSPFLKGVLRTACVAGAVAFTAVPAVADVSPAGFTFAASALALKLPAVPANYAFTMPGGAEDLSPAGWSFGGMGTAAFDVPFVGPGYLHGTVFGGLAYGGRTVPLETTGPATLTWAGLGFGANSLSVAVAAAFATDGITAAGSASAAAAASGNGTGFAYAVAQGIPVDTDAFALAAAMAEDGAILVAAGAFPAGAVALQFASRTRLWGGSLAYAVGGASFSPRVGVFVQGIDTAFETTLTADLWKGDYATGLSFGLHERLQGLYVGPVLGFDAGGRLGANAAFRVGVEGAPLYLAAAYSGHEVNTMWVDGPSPDSTTFVTSPVTMTGARWTGYGAIEGAVDIGIGRSATLSLGGGFRYMHDSPAISRLEGPFGAAISVSDVPPNYSWGAGATGMTAEPAGLVGLSFAPAYAFSASVGITIGLGAR